MKTLNIKLPGKSYKIYFGKNEFKQAFQLLKTHLKENRVFIVTNPKIKKLYQKKINTACPKQLQLIWICIPAGEKHKTLKTYSALLHTLCVKHANRSSALLALGGGVVGDLAGFVAATYMRGIDYFQMPTTLLAQVDASVGGKTGLDLPEGKNLAGCFYQPKAVFIFTEFLKTLSNADYNSGLAEVIKHAIIADKTLFDKLKILKNKIGTRNQLILQKIIFRCCQIKASIVQKDEKEANIRAVLNFGHTLGHAIEQLTHYKKVSHGQAVAMGMAYATDLSVKLVGLPLAEAHNIKQLIALYQLPVQCPKIPKPHYRKALTQDKKTQSKIIRFILVSKIGKTKIEPLSIKAVTQCL